MKRILFLFSAIALLIGCNNAEEMEPAQGGGAFNSELPEVIHASVADEKESADSTRTYVENDKDILWHNGDAISYFTGGSHAHYVFNGEDGAENATFEQKESLSNTSVTGSYAVYPYSESNACDASGSLSVVYPADQTYAPNSFGKGANLMVAESAAANEKNLYFRNACGYLVIKLYGEGLSVKDITLTAHDNVKIAGKATIIKNQGELTVEMTDEGSPEVTLDCGEGVALGATAEEATEFWFALPPVKMDKGITILVTLTNLTQFVKQTSGSVNIQRSNVQPMAAINLESTANHVLKYTTNDGKRPNFEHIAGSHPFNTTIVGITYENGQGVFTFAEPLTHINDRAFYGLGQLTSITLPNSLVSIGEEAFYGTSLSELTIPGSVTSIGNDAFHACEKLESITFESGSDDLRIGCLYESASEWGPFWDSKKLTTLSLDRNLVPTYTIDGDEEGLFSELPTLSSVTLGNNVTAISNRMFLESGITEITIPASVNKIDQYAFYKCASLNSITFEEGDNDLVIVENNGNGPFYHSPLATINLNRELVYQDVDGNAFVADSRGEGIFDNNTSYDERAEVNLTLSSKVKTIHNCMFAGLPIKTFTIPSSVTRIGDFAFDDCEKLESLTFEDSDTPLTIGFQPHDDQKGTFYDSPLKTIRLNRELQLTPEYADALDQLDEGIFTNKTSYPDNAEVDLTISSKVKTIHYCMFAGLPIKTFTIPGSVTSIGDFAFDDCEKLESLTFEDGNTPLTIGFQPHSDQKGTFYDSPLKTISLKRELRLTSAYADALNQVDEGIFANDTEYDEDAVLNLTLSNSLETIYDYMFANLPINNPLNENSNVKTIGVGAFHSNKALRSLFIPNTVTSIEYDAFHACENLESITFESGTEKLKIGPLYESSTEYGPFYDSKKLTTLSLDRNLEPTYNINYDRKGFFSEIGTLKNVTLGSNVKTIHNRMFLKTGITEITIPASVNKIDKYAFYKCNALASITFKSGDNNLVIVENGNGPFYHSPLATINLDRELVYQDVNGNKFVADSWNEGIFANEHYGTVNNNIGMIELTIGTKVRTIHDYMFAYLKNNDPLKNTKVTTIGVGAFHSNPRLVSLTIPGTVTSIGEDAFHACEELKSITFESGTADLHIGCLNDASKEWGPFYDSKKLTTLSLDRNLVPTYDINYDRKGFFSENINLKNVTLGSNVKTIHNRMFLETGITEITIPASVNLIDQYAFYGCESLKTVKLLGTTPPSFGGGAVFSGCNLDIIYVPSSATSTYKNHSYWGDWDDIITAW